MAFLIWVSLAIVCYVCYEWLSAKYSRFKKHPPSPRGIPLVGNAFQLLFTNYSSSTRLGNELGGSYMLKVLNKRVLFLTSWADMKETLVNQADVFSTKATFKDEGMAKFNSFTFLFIDGLAWKEKRRFTLHHLRNFGFGKTHMENTILDEFQRVTDILDQRHRMTFNHFFFTPFLNVIWGVLASKTYDLDDDELKRISEAIKATFAAGFKATIVSMIPWLKHIPGNPFTKEAGRNWKMIMDFIGNQVADHKKSLCDGEPRDYMDAYLMEIKKHQGTELKDENLCYQEPHLTIGIYDILLAGVETTATTLEWSLLYMATWPEIQRKVQDELDTIIGRNRRTVYSDSAMLPYTKAVLLEVQRYCTVVPICSPRVTKRIATVNNYVIPQGTIVFQNLYAAHHDKKLWGDPDTFRPERFLSADHGKADTLDGWIPFSLGPRICIGESLARMELFLYFTGLLHKYSFRIVTGHAPPSLVPVSSLTLQPQPFELAIRQR